MQDHEVAVLAAEAGATVVRGRIGSRFVRIAKSGDDFATDVDVVAEHAMLGVIRRYRPMDGVTAEESGETGPTGQARRWLVDPLCGTVNYAAGTGPVGVNVALRELGQVTGAAVADPLAGEVIWTDGHRSFVRHGTTDRPAVPDTTLRLVDLNLDAPTPTPHTMRTVRLLADRRFQIHFRPRVSSTSLALAWVAVGKRAAYMTEGDMLDNVHFAAAIAVCLAAGCVVTNLSGGSWHRRGGGLIAAGDEATHAALVVQIAASHGLGDQRLR